MKQIYLIFLVFSILQSCSQSKSGNIGASGEISEVDSIIESNGNRKVYVTTNRNSKYYNWFVPGEADPEILAIFAEEEVSIKHF